MAFFLNSKHTRQLIIIILTGFVKAGMAATTDMPQDTTMEDTMETPTNIIETTTTRPDTTSVHSTTFNFQPIIDERDQLKQESDSLRAAVIVLGILAALFLIALIIGIIWFLRRRKQSKKMDTSQDVRSSSTSVIATQNEMTTTKVTETKTYQKKSPIIPRATEPPAKKVSGNVLVPPVGIIDDQECYENTKESELVRSNSTQSNDSQEYVQIDPVNTKSKTTTGISATTAPTTSPIPQKNTTDDNEPDDIYENCGTVPEASGNYSTLDTDKQYAHHYSPL